MCDLLRDCRRQAMQKRKSDDTITVDVDSPDVHAILTLMTASTVKQLAEKVAGVEAALTVRHHGHELRPSLRAFFRSPPPYARRALGSSWCHADLVCVVGLAIR